MKMTKEVTKSPKTKQKFTNKTSKNGENNGVFGKQENNKMGVRKKFTEDNNHKSRKNQENNSSFESSRKKFGEKRGNFESNFGKNSKSLDFEKKITAKKAVKIQSLEVGKKKFGEKKKNIKEEESILRIERKNLLMKNEKKFGKKKKNIDDDDDDSVEAKPKRKKRVIKIDPYDFSNKRHDDGNALKEITNQKEKEKKKKEEAEEKGKLSANAQFRAIKPSPSILTFVEDNFLGRRRDIELRRAGYDTELSSPLDNIPFLVTSERARIEESLFRNKLEFFAAAKVSSSFPPPGVPEIAFAGRSNVGKSSLLNSLTRQWGVVRTSDKPGHTQSINFFNLGTKVNLVDLPGYGFAYAKEEVKEAWEDLVKEYVSTRIGLKRVCLLIDTKWGMKPRDHELVHLMERHQTKFQVVLTKTDTVFPIDVARRAMQIEETLKAHKNIVQPVMMVSSKSGAGIRCLRTALSKIARFVKP